MYAARFQEIQNPCGAVIFKKGANALQRAAIKHPGNDEAAIVFRVYQGWVDVVEQAPGLGKQLRWKWHHRRNDSTACRHGGLDQIS